MTDQTRDDALLAVARVLDGEPGWTVCLSRCLWCGRQTPHGVCHDHNSKNNEWRARLDAEEIDHEALWAEGFDREPEECQNRDCSLWEDGEFDLKFPPSQPDAAPRGGEGE